MELKDGGNIKIRWMLTVAITSIAVYLVFQYVLPLILPFVVAYFLAWIIRPLTEFLYRKLRLSRIIGGTISLILLIAVAGTGIFYLINVLIKQAVALIKNIPIYMDIIADKLDSFCTGCDKLLGLAYGTMRGMVDDNLLHFMDHIRTEVMPGITERTLAIAITVIGAVGLILIVFVATLLIVKDLPYYKEKYKDNRALQDIRKITQKLSDAGIAYLRSQLIIALIVALICVLGLILIKNDYALLLGIGIAIFDAFPILGSGIIFMPWSIIMLFNGNIYTAAILITTYLLCQIVREVLEPKLIGNRIGVKPIFTLISMYVGVKLFSFAGFFLGPIGLIIIITIVKVVNEKLDVDTSDEIP